MRHLLSIRDLTVAELNWILAASEQPARRVLQEKGVGLYFEKPSSRTRNSMEMAVFTLGGHPVSMQAEEVGLGVRESVEDVVRTLAGYHRFIGARVFDHATLEAMAAVDAVPIINLLSDFSHPLQTLADLLTLRQHWRRLAGRTVAWIGDGNNVARSLIIGCGLAGMHIKLACPAGHEPDPVAVDAARSAGVEVLVTDDPAAAAEGADAVCTDVWVSMGQESEAKAREDAFARYQVNQQLMDKAAPDALFLHCLPAHRGLEVTAEVIDGPASVVWDQAANRMLAARGLLVWLHEHG